MKVYRRTEIQLRDDQGRFSSEKTSIVLLFEGLALPASLFSHIATAVVTAILTALVIL